MTPLVIPVDDDTDLIITAMFCGLFSWQIVSADGVTIAEGKGVSEVSAIENAEKFCEQVGI